MKILVVGDTHMNGFFWKRLAWVAEAAGADCIVQLGDFGYFPHVSSGQFYLKKVQKILHDANLNCYFLDGNHENHEALQQLTEETHRHVDEGFVRVSNNLFYVPRGLRWCWDGTAFAALGGAFSIDVGDRTQGVDWWPDELTTQRDVRKCLEHGPVDVMFVHDPPDGVTKWERTFPENSYKLDRISRGNRKLIRAAVEHLLPDVVYHGHMHHRYSEKLELDSGKTVLVEGLSCEDDKSYVLLDTEKGW